MLPSNGAMPYVAYHLTLAACAIPDNVVRIQLGPSYRSNSAALPSVSAVLFARATIGGWLGGFPSSKEIIPSFTVIEYSAIAGDRKHLVVLRCPEHV